MNTILQLHSKAVTSIVLITSIAGLMVSIYAPLPEYYGTAVSVAIWVFSLWALKRIRSFYIAAIADASQQSNPYQKKRETLESPFHARNTPSINLFSICGSLTGFGEDSAGVCGDCCMK